MRENPFLAIGEDNRSYATQGYASDENMSPTFVASSLPRDRQYEYGSLLGFSVSRRQRAEHSKDG